MPRGAVWPRDPDALQTKVIRGLSSIYAQNTARANNLLIDSFPGTAFELLPEWEKTLGLPDPCAGVAPTIEARRAQVVARLAAVGGQSVAYFIQLATNLGYWSGPTYLRTQGLS
ncbi:putative phage tail protein [Pandoraea apista]|nr:putative phage tail protein [Pandoraea apista]